MVQSLAVTEMIIFEVECDPAVYSRVNDILGLDPSTGSGGWPKELLNHVAAGADGKIIVVEVWGSRAAQLAWMSSTLGPALHQAGEAKPTRQEWYTLLGNYSLSR